MNKTKIAQNLVDCLGKAAAWTTKKSLNGALRTGEYAYDNRQQIFEGVKLAGVSTAQAAKGFGQSIYDTASLKVFSKDNLTLDVRFQFRPLRRVILQFFDC